MEKEKLIKTSIKGFDEAIGGGLPQGSCILLISSPMVETQLFCVEYIYQGLKNGEPGLMVTMDYSPEDLKLKGVEYGWLMEEGEKKNILKWVDGYSLNANKDVQSTETIKRIGGSIALSDLTIGMSKFQRDFHQVKDNYKFVFDSLSTLFIYNEVNTIYRFLRVIVSKLRESGGVGFFTMGEGMHSKEIEMTLRHMVDGTLQLTSDLKMNILSLPTPCERKNFQLSLSKEKGFEVVK